MTETAQNAPLDQDAIREFAFQVWSYKQGELVSLMVHLGDRLGIYRTMAGAGPLTPAEVAEKTGLQPRWILEWLRGQAAARLLHFHSGTEDGDDVGRFELTDVQAEVLAHEDKSLFFAAGAFGEPMEPANVGKLAGAFVTGVGLTYDQLGPCACHRTERMLGPWSRLALVPQIVPALDGVQAKLEAGAKVCDVGCGSGIALAAMAKAFPNSTFHGLDLSTHAIERAQHRKVEEGLGNAEFFLKRGEELEAGSDYDFVLTFDCLHDMTRPDVVIEKIRGAIKDDGTWLIKDIRSKPRFEDNLRNPMLALLYGFSVSSCMSSALSEPDGLGLGTLGFNPEVAERMTSAGGFSRFQLHDFDDPSNLYYEVRP